MEEQRKVLIDPTKESYCFTFSNRDCYKLATGRCTFELTDEEYELEKERCNLPYHYEGRVGYCRELYEKMKDGGTLSATSSKGIIAYRNVCGHTEFVDGQHRSCIAKKKKLPELYFDLLGDNKTYLCHSCHREKIEAQKQKKIWYRLLYLFNKNKKHNFEKDGPIDITDDKL